MPTASRALRADLHTHSNASDGELAPAELVQRAIRLGLAVLALTDHDTTAGLPEALSASSGTPLRVVPGVEISTDVPRGELHLLGYGIQPDDRQLAAALEQFRDNSLARLRRMLEILREQGVDLPASAIKPTAGESSVGRPHVARAMVEAGYVNSVVEAFERFLGEGRPAYVRKVKLDPLDAVRLVRDSGGIPVLAHPRSVPELDLRLPRLVEAGLAGIECFYSEYDETTTAQLVRVADEAGLLVTGGSDFHGEHTREERVLGSVRLPPERIERFLEALDRLVAPLPDAPVARSPGL